MTLREAAKSAAVSARREWGEPADSDHEYEECLTDAVLEIVAAWCDRMSAMEEAPSDEFVDHMRIVALACRENMA